MWRESLSCAYLAQLPDESIRTLARSLADSLIETKSYHAAAEILAEHLNEYSDAARIYCKGHFYSDAIRILALHRQSNLLSEIVDVELAEGFSTLTEFISECKGQLRAQIPRLQELRDKKRRDPLAFYEGAAEAGQAGVDIPDNVSLAPSETTTAGGTLLTRYTGRNSGTVATGASRRTSKNRRREERKRARGKKGSVYEEEYLVNSVSRLLQRVDETRDDVERAVQALCRRAMWERARALESGFGELVESCQRSVPEVWQEPVEQKTEQTDEEDTYRPAGGDGVLWDMEEARRTRVAPVVKPYTGSPLLK